MADDPNSYANLAAVNAAAQVAQAAAQQEYYRMRLQLVDIPMAELQKEQLAFTMAQQAWDNAFKEASLTGMYNGVPTTEWLTQQAALTGEFMGQETFPARIAEAQVTGYMPPPGANSWSGPSTYTASGYPIGTGGGGGAPAGGSGRMGGGRMGGGGQWTPVPVVPAQRDAPVPQGFKFISPPGGPDGIVPSNAEQGHVPDDPNAWAVPAGSQIPQLPGSALPASGGVPTSTASMAAPTSMAAPSSMSTLSSGTNQALALANQQLGLPTDPFAGLSTTASTGASQATGERVEPKNPGQPENSPGDGYKYVHIDGGVDGWYPNEAIQKGQFMYMPAGTTAAGTGAGTALSLAPSYYDFLSGGQPSPYDIYTNNGIPTTGLGPGFNGAPATGGGGMAGGGMFGGGGLFGGGRQQQQQPTPAGYTGYTPTLERESMESARALSLMGLGAQLRGPANAFQFATTIGNTPAGLQDILAAAAGTYNLAGYGGQQGYAPQPVTLPGYLQELQWTAALGSGAQAPPAPRPPNPQAPPSAYQFGTPQQPMPYGAQAPAAMASPVGAQAPVGAYNYQPTNGGNAYVYPPGIPAPAGAAQVSSTGPLSPEQLAQLNLASSQMAPGVLPNQINAQNYQNFNQYQKDLLWAAYENAGWDPNAAQQIFQASLPQYAVPLTGGVRI